MKKPKGLADADMEVMESAATGRGLFEIKGANEFQKLRDMATATHDAFFSEISPAMTHLRARRIKQLRVDHDCSWRSVAEICHAVWPNATWQPPSNQLAGMALCEAAAKQFGEHYMSEPWN